MIRRLAFVTLAVLLPVAADAQVRPFVSGAAPAGGIAALTNLRVTGISAVNEQGGCPAGDGVSGSYAGPPGTLDLGTLTSFVQIMELVTFTVAPR